MDHSFTCSQILEGPSLLGLVHYYSNFWQSPLYEVMEGHWTDVWPGCPGPSNRAREVVHSDSGATRGLYTCHTGPVRVHSFRRNNGVFVT